jgi:DUF4097 and DUF4098 domain-containing protein YvlB
MVKNTRITLIVVLGISALLTVAGCDVQIGDWHQAKYERTIQHQAPFAAGSTLVAETRFGSVTVAGADVADCNLVAKIVGRAPTEEEAKQIAEQVKIELERTGETLKVVADKPHVKQKRSVSISYSITVPRQTHVQCGSSYGPIDLMDLDGNVKGKTSSGSVKAHNIQGPVQLETSYGSVTCKHISGDNIRLKSSSGSITAENIVGPAHLETAYGPVTCKDFSGGDIILKSSSGKITLLKASFGDCDAHTSYGSIIADGVTGNLIKLHSSSGGITVKQASAKTADISTSYGRINCQRITANDIAAKSGSGDIDIVCSEKAAAEIIASAVTAYGSIEFTAPPNFAGQVELSTSYGSVRTDLPITITGEVSKKKLAGTVGEGKGKLHLETRSGSIILK